MYYPLKERAAVRRDAERLLEGRNAEGSFQAGNLKKSSRVSRFIPVTG